jgi:hypothetical protein
VGTTPARGHQRAQNAAPISNRVKTRATKGEIGAQGGCSPQEETLEHRGNDGDAGMARVDDGGLQLHRENVDEHGLGKLEWLGPTGRCPALRAKGESSPRQRTRQTRDDGHRTVVILRRSSTGARAERE